MTGSWLLDLCEPPDGFRFIRGVLLAHDVDWTLVTDVIAPALTGVVGSERNTMYRTARAVEGAELLVLGCAGRETFGPLHTWARLGSVFGRTQHAKIGVLQFQHEGGTATKTRGYVASANLTRGGLLRNREVFVVDEITGQHRRNSLVADVFNVLGALSGASDMAPSVSADLAATIRKMRAATPNSKAAKQLVHSVGGEQGMLKRIVPPPGRSVRRIVIVSPGHSINGSALAQHFGDLGLLSDQPQVDIYTGLDGPDQLPIFSPSFIAGLRHRGATVELHGVPGAEIVDGRSQNRPLHAKLIATVDDQEDALSLAGSANCSPSGWLGKNREAMVLQHGTARHLDRLISELRAKPKAFDPVAPPPQATSAASSGNPPAGLPVLDSLRRQGDDLIGSISLAGLMKDGSKVVGVRLGGRKIIVEALARDLQIPERNAVIEVTVEHADGTKQTFRFQLGGGMPEWHPHLWRADPDDVPDRTDAWLLALIGDLRTASSKAGHKSNFLPSAADDAYRVPLYRRLALVARHHRALQDSLAKDDLVQAIDRYFVGQERAVALSLVTNQPAADGAILAALNDVVTGRA